MRKRLVLFVLCLVLLFVLTGCWNYRGLNEILIVSGITVDINPDNGNYELCFEIVDMTKNVQQSGPSAKLIESEGKTLFDAARNAKKRLEKKLYFGNTQIVVLSQEVAKSENLSMVIDWFLRDAELRETACVLVSREKTAKEILSIDGLDHGIVAYGIYNIISDDQAITASTANIRLYQIYNTLHGQGLSLTLPAFHNVINDEELVSEAEGIAVFHRENLIGFLTPEQSKYFLFATGKVEGGILTLSSSGDGKDDVSLEISQSKTKQSFSYEGGSLKVTISTEISAFLAEIGTNLDALDEEKIKSLEAAAGAMVKQKMAEVVHYIQTEYRSDIFGFGNMIHKRDAKLWKQLSEKWDDIFPTLEVVVNAEVKILNTAYMKKT